MTSTESTNQQWQILFVTIKKNKQLLLLKCHPVNSAQGGIAQIAPAPAYQAKLIEYAP